MLYQQNAAINAAKIMGVTLSPPSAVTDLSASAGDGQVVLGWSAPANNGYPITAYIVQYGTVASGAFASTLTDDATPGATVSGLVNGTAYQFRVVARNSAGDSAVSNVVTAIPVVDNSIPVTWVDLVGVTANGNSITKTVATGWTNGGAASSPADHRKRRSGIPCRSDQYGRLLRPVGPATLIPLIRRSSYAIYMAYNGTYLTYMKAGHCGATSGTYTSGGYAFGGADRDHDPL